MRQKAQNVSRLPPLPCANANKDGGVVTKAVVSSAMAAYFHRLLPDDGAVRIASKTKIWKPYTGPAAELQTWSIL